MASFLTQCPHCLTSFRVTETQLEAADGMVRCGACLGIFSATTNHITLKQPPVEAPVPDELPEPEAPEALVVADPPGDEVALEINYSITLDYAPSQAARAPAPAAATAEQPELDDNDPLGRSVVIPLGDFDLDTPDDYDEDEDEDEDEDYDEFEEEYTQEKFDAAPPAPAPRAAPERVTTDKAELRQYLAALDDDEALEPLDEDTLDAVVEEPITLTAARARGRLAAYLLFFGANLLGVVLLAFQYTQANLDSLSRSARFAPGLPYVCRVLDCPQPERSRLDSLVSEQLLVRSHPRYSQALEVSFVFRNDAPEAQPFPAIELGFSDSSKRLLANRLFQPAEYLPPELQSLEMPAQSSLQITLELADPGSEAVNYTLAFRAP